MKYPAAYRSIPIDGLDSGQHSNTIFAQARSVVDGAPAQAEVSA